MRMQDYGVELERLKREKFSQEAKEKILDFLNYLQNREELSVNRLYFYSDKLRMIARSMGDTFLNPTEKDIENALAAQKKRKELSEWTIEGYKTTFKKFYTWMGKEDVIKWIKRNNRPNYKKKPDFLISQEEVDILVSACDNARDKAIFALFYDTGIRLGELLSLRIQDIIFDDSGMRITVSGKTGTRVVRAVGDSIGYVRNWLNVHPDMFNEDSWLFCGIGHDMREKLKLKEPMEEYAIYRMFSKVKGRAVKMGFPESKRVYPHMFRHNRATQWASKIREPVLEKMMGWIPSSRMTRVYVHLNDEDADTALLEALGMQPVKKTNPVRKPRLCISCKTPNPGKSKFCLQCGRPLMPEDAQKADDALSKISEGITESDVIPAMVKAVLRNLPKESRVTTINDILEFIKGDKELMKGLMKEFNMKNERV